MESGYAASIGRNFNPISIVITYSIVVFLVRRIYKKNKNFENKVLVTFSIYIGVYLLKALIGIAIGISILKLAN